MGLWGVLRCHSNKIAVSKYSKSIADIYNLKKKRRWGGAYMNPKPSHVIKKETKMKKKLCAPSGV